MRKVGSFFPPTVPRLFEEGGIGREAGFPTEERGASRATFNSPRPDHILQGVTTSAGGHQSGRANPENLNPIPV